ncbi:unnamed protein product [Calypogeia fissa]
MLANMGRAIEITDEGAKPVSQNQVVRKTTRRSTRPKMIQAQTKILPKWAARTAIIAYQKDDTGSDDKLA